MRRFFALALVLFLLSSGGLIFAQASVNFERDTLEYAETIHEGSAEAARGVEVELTATSGRQLVWDISLHPGCAPQAEFEFHDDAVRIESEIEYYGVHINQYYESNGDLFDQETPPEGIGRAYWELAQECQPGQEFTREFRYRDYAEYYPITVNIDLPGFWYDWNGEDFSVSTNSGDNDSPIHETIAEYFRIPVLEEHIEEIHVHKDADGRIRSWGGGAINCWINLWTHSAITEDACYFAVTATGSGDEPVDMSHIPGGYGIYCLPYHRNDDGITSISPDKLSTVFSLEEEAYVEYLTLDAQQKHLLLFTTEDERAMMTVIAIDGMREVMKTELFEYGKNGSGLHRIFEGEDFLVVWGAGSCLAVLTPDGDGRWTKEFLVTPEKDDDILGFLSTNAAVDFDGERLLIAAELYYEDKAGYYGYDSTSFYVTVYDKTGRIFYADYTSGLDRGDNKYMNNRCWTLSLEAEIE